MGKKKLVVISVDALNMLDFNYIKELPIFNDFIRNGSYIEEVEAVYPTQTYCCHTSIVTGNYPMKHGIYANEIAEPSFHTLQNWFWHKHNIKSPTLFDVFTENGYKNAAVLWPVMASAKKSIPYNIPEIWSDRRISSFQLFLQNGSLKLLPYIIKHRKKMKGKEQPYLDNFTEAVSLEIIKNKRPDTLFIHLTEIDTLRHYEGLYSPKVYQAIDSVHSRISYFIEALKESGQYEDTHIVILGDHGGKDFHHVILLNSLFYQKGWLDIESSGKISTWKVYANGCGGSAQLHFQKDLDKAFYEEVLTTIENFRRHESNDPILRIFDKEEVLRLFSLSGPFVYVIEANEGYIFKNEIRDHVIVEPKEVTKYHLEHGYLPTDPKLKTLFFAKGPGIRKGHKISKAFLVDEAPTLAKMMDVPMENVEGTLLDIFIE